MADAISLPKGNRACDVYAYSIDPDKSGTNIRRAASARSPVLQKIKSKHAGFESFTVHITGYSSGWFQINEAIESGTETPEFLFKGAGWVHASLLGSDGAGSGTPLFASPSAKSKQIGVIQIEDGATLKSCAGEWVEIKNNAKNLSGWAAPGTLCTNAISNCN